MSTDKIKSQNIEEYKHAVILIDKYTTVELSEIEEFCINNNLHAYCVIYNYTLCDTKPYKEIIKYIVSQDKPPVVIIDSNTCLFPQCIISSTILGTLEEMQLAKIHTYNTLSRQKKGDKLELIKQSTFDLLTEANYQLRSIETMYKNKQKIEKNRDNHEYTRKNKSN